MIIRVKTDIFIAVESESDAEHACSSLGSGLHHALRDAGFPIGEVLQAEVDHYERLTAEEISELGLEEEDG